LSRFLRLLALTALIAWVGSMGAAFAFAMRPRRPPLAEMTFPNDSQDSAAWVCYPDWDTQAIVCMDFANTKHALKTFEAGE